MIAKSTQTTFSGCGPRLLSLRLLRLFGHRASLKMSGYTRFAADDDVVERLAKSDWRERRSAIQALFERPEAQYATQVIEQLCSAAPWLRHDAGIALINLAIRLPPAALTCHVAALTENLRHEDPAVRRCCAHVLVIVDPAQATTLCRTGEERAKSALELAFQSDLVQPTKAISTLRVVAELIIAALACALFLAVIVWLSTRQGLPHHGHHRPCPYYCRSSHLYRQPSFGVQPRLSSSSTTSSSSDPHWRPTHGPTQSGRRRLEQVEIRDEDASAGDDAGTDGDWSADDDAGIVEGGALGAFGLGWRVWPWLLALAVVCFVALKLVMRYRKAKGIGSSSTRRTSNVAAPVVTVTATSRTTTLTTTTSVIEEVSLLPPVSVRMEPLVVGFEYDDESATLGLPPSQVVRSLIEPCVARVHHEIFAAHLPYRAFPRDFQGLSALERVAHATADRITRSYMFNQPILSCAPHPSPLFAVPAVHWAAAPAVAAQRFYADIVFMCSGAVPFGTQQLGDADASTIELNPSGIYKLQPVQSRTDDIILLGHPTHWEFGKITLAANIADPPEWPEPAESPRNLVLVIGAKYSHNVGEGWRVGDESNPLSQILRELDAAVAKGSQLTILAPSHTVAHLTAGLLLPAGTLTHMAAKPRVAMLDNVAHGSAAAPTTTPPEDFSSATHVLILEAEAMEAVALAAVAHGARVAVCRAGRFCLSEETEAGEATRALTDYTLPHPRIFGPEAEEKVIARTMA